MGISRMQGSSATQWCSTYCGSWDAAVFANSPQWSGAGNDNDSISGEFRGKWLYLRNAATYKHGTCAIVLPRTSAFYWYPYCSTRVYLSVSMPKYAKHSTVWYRHWSTFGECHNDRISHGDKTWACGRRVMWLPEHAIISEKVPSGKKQGMSSDDTSISYLCPNLNFDGL